MFTTFYAVPQGVTTRSHLYAATVHGAVVRAFSEADAARLVCSLYGWRATRIRPAAVTPSGRVAAWRVYNAGGIRLASVGGYNAALASTVLR